MAVLLSQFLPCHLGSPVSLYITCCSGCTTRKPHMSKPAKPFLKRRSRSSSSSFDSSSLDHTVATSSGLIQQICLIMALLLPCMRCRLILVNGQVSLACTWHSTFKSCTHGACLVREMAGCEKTKQSHMLWVLKRTVSVRQLF